MLVAFEGEIPQIIPMEKKVDEEILIGFKLESHSIPIHSLYMKQELVHDEYFWPKPGSRWGFYRKDVFIFLRIRLSCF